jgi:subtilase family serine protease
MTLGTRVRGFGAVVGASVLLVTGVTLVASVGGAGAAGSPGRVTVPQGQNPTKIAGASEIGPADEGSQISVSFVLKAQNQSELFALASAATQQLNFPESQFADVFGQTPTVINGLKSYLKGFGIATYAYSNGLDVSATGTITQIDNALGITIDDFAIPSQHGVQDVFASKTDPSLPVGIAANILAILGLTDYSSFASQATPALHQPGAAPNGTIPAGELTPANFSSHYNLTPLLNAGDLGQGQTLGIVTLASLDPTVPVTFWRQYLHISTLPNRITLDNVDGGSGPVSLDAGSDETTLDVEQSGAIAPQAKIIVYQAPNTDPGFYDAFNAAASQDLAGSVSTSWGDDETEFLQAVNAGSETPAYEAAFDQVFAEMVLQNQAGFDASGDVGAFADLENGAGSPTDLTVSTLSDSAFMTSVGATTLPGTQTYAVEEKEDLPNSLATESVTIPTERAWSWDYLWPLYLALGEPSEQAAALDSLNQAGSGGGYSVLEPRPAYQRGVSGIANFDDREFLTPTDFETINGLTLPFGFNFTASPSLGTGTGTGRVQPDLSFDGDPQTGYAVYDPQLTQVFGSPVVDFGGTSFTAPQLNGVAADYDSAINGRLGFWNQFIYRAAESSSSPFTPMDSNTLYGSSYFSATNSEGGSMPLTGAFANDNLYYTGRPGTIFNPASGLGYANLTALFNYAKSH